MTSERYFDAPVGGRWPWRGDPRVRRLREARARLFDAGEIRIIILQLLSEQPSYGYQLIKTLAQRLAGGYAPSAGVIYPTLTMLEEEGLAISSLKDNKKVYSLTPEGMKYLEANRQHVQQLLDRLDEVRRGYERGRSPEILRAFMNLQRSMEARLSRANVTPKQIRKLAEALDAAAKAIEEI